MRKNTELTGFRFTKPKEDESSLFERLLDIFQELLTHTSGDFDEAVEWLRALDDEYKLTNEDYTIDDFIEELLKKEYIREEFGGDGDGEGEGEGTGGYKITDKTEQSIRRRALNQIFGKLKKSKAGNHKSVDSGPGTSETGDKRQYRFGDRADQISMTESLKNAYTRHGIDDLRLTEDDLVVNETRFNTQMSTVLMIDISHSMILYGEDRITPAKKVAMALSELITTRYPKDSIDVIVFGNDAWPVKIKDLPYLKVGPYHTNTVAGLKLAMDILRRKKSANKQIFMITDGKPSCLNLPNGEYYKNSVGLDPYITQKCFNMAAQAKKLDIPITTFMIARDPYLTSFVEEFTRSNQGKAFYSGLGDLGEMIFEDYENNKKKRRLK